MMCSLKGLSICQFCSKAIVQIAKEDQTIRVRELADSKANRTEVERALSTDNLTRAFFNGHGDEETV